MEGGGVARRYRPKYKTKNEEIVAGLREAAGAGPPIDPEMKIKRLAAELSAAMALKHGGEFHLNVDHEKKYVLVAPRPPWERSSREFL